MNVQGGGVHSCIASPVSIYKSPHLGPLKEAPTLPLLYLARGLSPAAAALASFLGGRTQLFGFDV